MNHLPATRFPVFRFGPRPREVDASLDQGRHMLFAEHAGDWTVQDYILLFSAIGLGIERAAAWLKSTWREDAKIKRDQDAEDAKADRDRRAEEKASRKLDEVKDTLTETTMKTEIAAAKREEILVGVAAGQKVLVKQTDGMGKALNTALEEGAFAKGRLTELDKEAIVKEVVAEVNGHGTLEEVAATTKEIKSDTAALVERK